jgi:hypothetical protein|tara:strand:- start:1893 stop:2264 length:372 start_codon:yes stop_codon:yes gene_type:complete
MADFPALEPSTRAYLPGDYPQEVHMGASGSDVRFIQGTDRTNQRLTLGYEYLTESEVQQILDHFETQQGSLIPFDLPATIWSGYTTPPVSSSDYQWRYASSFTIQLSAPLRYNTSIDLVTVPV